MLIFWVIFSGLVKFLCIILLMPSACHGIRRANAECRRHCERPAMRHVCILSSCAKWVNLKNIYLTPKICCNKKNNNNMTKSLFEYFSLFNLSTYLVYLKLQDFLDRPYLDSSTCDSI